MSYLVYQLLRLSYGMLVPAYNSFKAVKSKDGKLFARSIMYWTVFAVYSFIESFTDIFLSWLPLYWEMKIMFIIWLILPATKGSVVLYTRFLHPMLLNKEKDIDRHLDKVKDHCYNALVYLGSKGFSTITNIFITASIKGQAKLINHLKSLSMSDLRFEDSGMFQTRYAGQLMKGNFQFAANPRRRHPMKDRSLSSPMPCSMSRLGYDGDYDDNDNDMSSRWATTDYYSSEMQLSVIPEDSAFGTNADIFELSDHRTTPPKDVECHQESSIELLTKTQMTDEAKPTKLTSSITQSTSLNMTTNKIKSVKKKSIPLSPWLSDQKPASPIKIPPGMPTKGPLDLTVQDNPATGDNTKHNQSETFQQHSDLAPLPRTKSSGFTKAKFMRSFSLFEKSTKTTDNKYPGG